MKRPLISMRQYIFNIDAMTTTELYEAYSNHINYEYDELLKSDLFIEYAKLLSKPIVIDMFINFDNKPVLFEGFTIEPHESNLHGNMKTITCKGFHAFWYYPETDKWLVSNGNQRLEDFTKYNLEYEDTQINKF